MKTIYLTGWRAKIMQIVGAIMLAFAIMVFAVMLPFIVIKNFVTNQQ